MSWPVPSVPTAVAMRPKLKLTPVPVARTDVGKNSGRHSGSQPKYSVPKNPIPNTNAGNNSCPGGRYRNSDQLNASDARLIPKYVSRRPNRAATQPPTSAPTAPPADFIHCVHALSAASDSARVVSSGVDFACSLATFPAHGTSQLALPQFPIIGTAPSTMPSSV